jgi:hypothetical protein
MQEKRGAKHSCVLAFLIKDSSFHGLKIRKAGRQEKRGAKPSCLPAFLIQK